jgi:hypothetical protein
MGATKKKSRPLRSREVGTVEEARLAVNLPVHLHRQLKARAAAEGRSIRDFILDMLRKNGIG